MASNVWKYTRCDKCKGGNHPECTPFYRKGEGDYNPAYPKDSQVCDCHKHNHHRPADGWGAVVWKD